MSALILLPLLLAAGTIIWLGWRGRPMWSTPSCRKCGYDLRGKDPDALTACHECGADLATKHAVLFVRAKSKRWGLMVWGVALLLMPFAMLAGFALLQTIQLRMNPQVSAGPHQMGQLTTDQLIQYQLPAQFDEPWVWQELEQRLRAGQLTSAQADAAVQALGQAMLAQKPQGWDGPMHWSDKFLAAAWGAGLVSDTAMGDFYEAYHGPGPVISRIQRVREGDAEAELELTFGNDWGGQGIAHKLLWRVMEVSVDGQIVPLDGKTSYENQWDGRFETASLSPGKHEVQVTLDCILIDTSRIPGFIPQNLPPANWPQDPLRRWTTQASQPFTVYAAQQRLVTLKNDPAMDPVTAGALKIKGAAVVPVNGKTSIAVDFEFPNPPSIPLSFDLEFQLGSEVYPHGRLVHFTTTNGHTRTLSGGQSLILDALDPAIQQVDIHLTPNPDHVDEWPGVDRIWGKPIKFEGVSLLRLDLPAVPAQ